eukprot:Gb_16085 [translate_table: standard]
MPSLPIGLIIMSVTTVLFKFNAQHTFLHTCLSTQSQQSLGHDSVIKMAKKMNVFPLLVLLLLVLLASEIPKGVDGRTCKSQSHSFKGTCVSDHNCANVCKTEKFPSGGCDFVGVSRRCFCYKPC